MLTHDALNTYVADRQTARIQAATASRTARLLRRARTTLVQGSTGSAPVAAPAPALTSSSPIVAGATGSTRGATGAPAVAVLRTAAPAGAPEAA